jgi:hypothetical protein
MPIELAGISNENEFYTEHYLAAILDGDLRDTLSRWRRQAQEDGTRSPFEALRGLAGEFFRVRAAALRARAAEERLTLQHEFLGGVFTVLGYQPRPGWQPLEGGVLLPVLATLQRPNGAPELWVVEVLDSDQRTYSATGHYYPRALPHRRRIRPGVQRPTFHGRNGWGLVLDSIRFLR